MITSSSKQWCHHSNIHNSEKYKNTWFHNIDRFCFERRKTSNLLQNTRKKINDAIFDMMTLSAYYLIFQKFEVQNNVCQNIVL